jgi:hypothetical protein
MDISQLLDRYMDLSKLPEHVPTILISFFVFLSVHLIVAPGLSQSLFPDAFGNAARKARNSWCVCRPGVLLLGRSRPRRSVHVVSQLHALLVVALATRCLGLQDLNNDHAFGWDERVGFVHAIACGCVLPHT